MHIPLDRQQSIPLYLQIEEALRRAILSGVFVDGDKLPSTRTLAAKLAVSRLTVDNAYAELAAKGFCVNGAAAVPMFRTHCPSSRCHAQQAIALSQQNVLLP